MDIAYIKHMAAIQWPKRGVEMFTVKFSNGKSVESKTFSGAFKAVEDAFSFGGATNNLRQSRDQLNTLGWLSLVKKTDPTVWATISKQGK